MEKKGPICSLGLVSLDKCVFELLGDKAFSINSGHFHPLALFSHQFFAPPSLYQSPQPPGSIVGCGEEVPPVVTAPLPVLGPLTPASRPCSEALGPRPLSEASLSHFWLLASFLSSEYSLNAWSAAELFLFPLVLMHLYIFYSFTMIWLGLRRELRWAMCLSSHL